MRRTVPEERDAKRATTPQMLQLRVEPEGEEVSAAQKVSQERRDSHERLLHLQKGRCGFLFTVFTSL